MLPAPATTKQGSSPARYLDVPLRYSRQIIILSVIFALVAIVLLPQLRFDRNPLNLRDADSESVATLRELMEDSENPAMSITVLSPDATTKQAIATELAALPVVRDVISADNLVPEVTDLKLELIDDLALMLG